MTLREQLFLNGNTEESDLRNGSEWNGYVSKIIGVKSTEKSGDREERKEEEKEEVYPFRKIYMRLLVKIQKARKFAFVCAKRANTFFRAQTLIRALNCNYGPTLSIYRIRYKP